MRAAILLTVTLGACATGVPAFRQAEDRRDPDPEVFDAALADPAAVRALGRLVSPALVPTLERALARPETRALAAWALGQYGLVEGFVAPAPELVRPLLSVGADADPEVRAAVAVALGRLREEGAVRVMLGDSDARVRAAAALGLFWKVALDKVALEDASVDALLSAGADSALAFSRRAEPRAERLMQTLAAAGEKPETVLFAVRALGKLEAPSPATTELLLRLARSGERAVRIEAILALKDATSVSVDSADNVVVRAVRAQKTGEVLATEPSGWVRAQAIGHRAESGFDPAWLDDPDARVRAAGMAGIATLAGDAWQAPFEKGLSDADLNVRLAAVEALGATQEPGAEARLAALLLNAPMDVTLRGALAEAAAARKSQALAPALATLGRSSPDPGYVETRETVADALAALEAWELLAQMAADPAPSVRAKVATALAKRDGRAAPVIDRKRPEVGPYVGAEAAERLVIETTEGRFVIALDHERAPTTSAALTALARRGFYDGTRFHRLVPNFVIQGGDPTGTGWGDAGFHLRDEVSEVDFARGDVGIARAGPDTGSCQMFVMLAAAPHLSGRYTRVGRVVEGMDVVDRLELGSVIRHVSAD